MEFLPLWDLRVVKLLINPKRSWSSMWRNRNGLLSFKSDEFLCLLSCMLFLGSLGIWYDSVWSGNGSCDLDEEKTEHVLAGVRKKTELELLHVALARYWHWFYQKDDNHLQHHTKSSENTLGIYTVAAAKRFGLSTAVLKIMKKKNWNRVNLQCCVSFRYTQTDSVIYMCVCVYIFFFRFFPIIGYY